MKSRDFNSLMPRLNEEWAAKVLGMTRNSKNGPDLFDEKKITEIKFTKKYNSKNYYKWTVFDYQTKYPIKENKKGFWGMGFYDLNTEISDIRIFHFRELENFVNSREIYILDWNWMNQFEPHHTKGESKLSKWEYIFRYPKFKLMPKIENEMTVEGGKVYFTEGVNKKYFENMFQ